MNQNDQPDLFDRPAPAAATVEHEPLPVFAAGSETSRQAAISLYDRGNAPTQRERVFEFIKSCDDYGATREEIEFHFNLLGDSIRPRVKELLGEIGRWTTARIKRKDKSFNRKTRFGNQAEVLIAITP